MKNNENFLNKEQLRTKIEVLRNTIKEQKEIKLTSQNCDQPEMTKHFHAKPD